MNWRKRTSCFKMHTLIWTFLLVICTCVCSNDNLSNRSTTIISQSSTYESYTASWANDGNINTTFTYCSHTGLNKTIAWLQVDLGKPYGISSVKIYYRKEGNRSSDWRQYRFRQFYLDVSNFSATNSTTRQRTRCYTDKTTYPYLPPNIIDIPCRQTARYVIVETTYDAPEDDNIDEHGAILEICEIEVYGCNVNCVHHLCNETGYCDKGCIDGYWGHTCNSLCHVNCKESSCNRNTGHCNSCESDYWGDTCMSMCSPYCIGTYCDKTNGFCTHGCTTGRFGNTCKEICSSRCKNGTCNQPSGICLSGCIQNWSGDECDKCDSAHYGSTCSMECNPNCLNKTCNNITGLCTFGCHAGFYKEQCDRDCSSCPTGCDRFTGQCIGDCAVGKYGDFCHMSCSQDCQNGCNKYTGRCEEGCAEGKFGDFCNETCHARCESCSNPKTENVKSMQDSCSENLSILIGVCVVLSISVVVNGFTITWIVRHNGCKQPDVTRDMTKTDSNDFVAQQGIYHTTEDNAGYQELGQFSEPSHYDQLQT